ncbi:hypothetical protein [Sulfurimonas sp.]
MKKIILIVSLLIVNSFASTKFGTYTVNVVPNLNNVFVEINCKTDWKWQYVDKSMNAGNLDDFFDEVCDGTNVIKKVSFRELQKIAKTFDSSTFISWSPSVFEILFQEENLPYERKEVNLENISPQLLIIITSSGFYSPKKVFLVNLNQINKIIVKQNEINKTVYEDNNLDISLNKIHKHFPKFILTNTYNIDDIRECIDGRIWIKKYGKMSGGSCEWKLKH